MPFLLLSNVCYTRRNEFVSKLLPRQEADKNRISLKICIYLSYNDRKQAIIEQNIKNNQ